MVRLLFPLLVYYWEDSLLVFASNILLKPRKSEFLLLNGKMKAVEEKNVFPIENSRLNSPVNFFQECKKVMTACVLSSLVLTT